MVASSQYQGVSPPFRLIPPGEASGPWILTADVGVRDPSDFAVDLNGDEARVSFPSSSLASVTCQLPPGVPRIDAGAAECRFSSRKQQVRISWRPRADAINSPADAPETSEVPSVSSQSATITTPESEGSSGSFKSLRLHSLDEKIAALREECDKMNVAACQDSMKQGSGPRMDDELEPFDLQLVQTLARQVSKMHRTLPDADAEHMTDTIDIALETSGKYKDTRARARITMEVGRAFSQEDCELRAHCYEKAVLLYEAAYSSDGGRRNAHAYADSLVFLASTKGDDDALKETLLRTAIDVIGERSDAADEELRARAHRELAEVCARLRPEEASKHFEAAGSLFKGIFNKRAEVAADVEAGFAAPEGALKVPIQSYTFSDGEPEPRVTVRVKLDEALFSGASKLVTSEVRHCRAVFDPGSTIAVELQVAAPKVPGGDLVLWVLRLPRLRFPVVPGATALRLRKGAVSLVMKKEDNLPWCSVLRDGPYPDPKLERMAGTAS